MTFPGGELEGKRPNVLRPTCREKLRAAAAGGTSHSALRTSAPPHQLLCFECYRATVQRERALRAAGELDTASEERFQFQLPLEPVNRSRLARLRAERATERVASQAGAGRYVDRRRHAKSEARHALQHIVANLRAKRARSEQGVSWTPRRTRRNSSSRKPGCHLWLRASSESRKLQSSVRLQPVGRPERPSPIWRSLGTGPG